jgi:hypothetical protein
VATVLSVPNPGSGRERGSRARPSAPYHCHDARAGPWTPAQPRARSSCRVAT